MSNRTDFDNVATEISEIFGLGGDARERIKTELQDAFVAGQEVVPVVAQGGMPCLVSTAPTASVRLHSERQGDEPLEIDVDVTVPCDCGTTTTERHQLYKQNDAVFEVCDGCGASYRVDIEVGISFSAVSTKEADGVLSETTSAPLGGHHAR